MSKKNFTASFDSLLGEERATQKQRDKQEPARSVTTIITDPETLQKIRGIAYWDRIRIRDVINQALKTYIANYEATRGTIQLIPKPTSVVS